MGDRYPSTIAAARVRGSSRLTTAFAVTPLKILSPATHSQSCHAVLANYGGGFVSGDEIDLEISCGPEARLCVGTQANTRVFRAAGDAWSGQRVRGRVENDALAVLFQDPLVLHAGARFRQCQEWHLAAGASLLLVDWLSSGRHESGERFAFSAYENSIQLEGPAGPLLIDRLRLTPEDDAAMGMAPFGPFDQLLTVYLHGPATAPLLPLLATLSQRDRAPAPGAAIVTWHRFGETGGILRAMAANRTMLQPLISRLAAWLAPPELLGFDPCRRKW